MGYELEGLRAEKQELEEELRKLEARPFDKAEAAWADRIRREIDSRGAEIERLEKREQVRQPEAESEGESEA
jgi:hypothetical protein